MKLPGAAILLALASPCLAEPVLDAKISGLGFLVGKWVSDDGKVADTGGNAKGSSVFTVEANGGAILRRDHTILTDASGKATGDFDQIMLIYPDHGTVNAEYSDGQHLIHYNSADITPNSAVTFSSAAGAGPVFRLTYSYKAPDSLAVTFGLIPPGGSFQPIATGTLKRLSSK
jgi:hypothetical protein